MEAKVDNKKCLILFDIAFDLLVRIAGELGRGMRTDAITELGEICASLGAFVAREFPDAEVGP